jgi:glycyl-tRNA synthetase
MREFTQAELQIFFDPEKIEDHPKFDEIKNYKIRAYFVKNRESGKVEEITCEQMMHHLPRFYVYHMAKVQQFFFEVLRLPRELFRFRQLADEEKAFYNKYHWDIEVSLESLGGFVEVGGIHYRTDHDLSGHQKVSKKEMDVFVDGKRFVPHVLELSFGVDRNLYALLELAYKEDGERALFSFPRQIAPFSCAVFPLVSKDGLDERALDVKEHLKDSGFAVFYDDSGSVGRRYRRMDEIGVPVCITVDHKTLEDRTVTLRDRDSMRQSRVKISELAEKLKRFMKGEHVESLGHLV